MKSLIEFILYMIVWSLSATMIWIAWNQVSYLFPFLPLDWHYLGWWNCFCLTIVIRVVSTVMRHPDIKVPEMKK